MISRFTRQNENRDALVDILKRTWESRTSNYPDLILSFACRAFFDVDQCTDNHAVCVNSHTVVQLSNHFGQLFPRK